MKILNNYLIISKFILALKFVYRHCIYFAELMKKTSSNMSQELSALQKEKGIKQSQQLFKQLISSPSQFRPFINKCEDLYYDIIKMRMGQFANQIIQFINSCFSLIQDDKRNSVKTNFGADKLIIPVILKKGQEKYLKQFMRLIQKKILQQCQNQNTDKKKPQTALNIARKVNLYTFQNLTKISSITQNLKKKASQLNQFKTLHIYISDQITNLSEKQFEFIKEGLKDIKCVLIMPIYQSAYKYQNIEKNLENASINPVKMVIQKQLFCKFLFECISHPEIKAYLPSQSLMLIDQFNKSQITYKQAARRLIYVMDRLQVLRKQNNVNFQQVSIRKLFDAITKPLSRQFCYFYNESQDVQQYVRVILKQNEKISFLGKYISGMKSYLKEIEGYKSDDEIISKIRQIFKCSIEKQDSIKHLVSCLQIPKQVQQSPKKPKSKAERTLAQKVLQAQLRQMIDIMSQKIRNQAKSFAWEQFHFIQRLKAILPFSIFDSIAQLTKTHHEIIQFIYQKPMIHLVELIQKFCVKGSMDSEDLMNYIRDLQLQGLIQNSKINSKTVIKSMYFEEPVQRKLFFA